MSALESRFAPLDEPFGSSSASAIEPFASQFRVAFRLFVLGQRVRTLDFVVVHFQLHWTLHRHFGLRGSDQVDAFGFYVSLIPLFRFRFFPASTVEARIAVILERLKNVINQIRRRIINKLITLLRGPFIGVSSRQVVSSSSVLRNPLTVESRLDAMLCNNSELSVTAKKFKQ